MKTETNNALPTFPAFDRFACIGDSVALDVGPYTVRASLEWDGTTRPEDSDCYTPEVIEAWRRDEWCFVGVVLSVWADDILLDKHAASLWGIECNFPGTNNSYLSEVADDLLPEALDAANDVRARLIKKLKVEA